MATGHRESKLLLTPSLVACKLLTVLGSGGGYGVVLILLLFDFYLKFKCFSAFCPDLLHFCKDLFYQSNHSVWERDD